MLQDSYRERGQLQRKVDQLERRLAGIAHKISAGLVPDEGDLAAFPSAAATPNRVTEDGVNPSAVCPPSSLLPRLLAALRVCNKLCVYVCVWG